MNAQTLLSYFKAAHSEPKKPAKDFPPEAYTYDGAIDPKVVSAIQAEADKKIGQQDWSVTELLEDVLNEK